MAIDIQYLCIKFPTKGEVTTIRGRKDESRAVYMGSIEEEEDVHHKIMEVRDEEK